MPGVRRHGLIPESRSHYMHHDCIFFQGGPNRKVCMSHHQVSCQGTCSASTIRKLDDISFLLFGVSSLKEPFSSLRGDHAGAMRFERSVCSLSTIQRLAISSHGCHSPGMCHALILPFQVWCSQELSGRHVKTMSELKVSLLY